MSLSLSLSLLLLSALSLLCVFKSEPLTGAEGGGGADSGEKSASTVRVSVGRLFNPLLAPSPLQLVKSVTVVR